MTLLELKQLLNSLRSFYDKPKQLETEINKIFIKISANISSDLDRLILTTFKGYAEQLKIQVNILSQERISLKNAKIAGKNIFDRIDRNRKKLIISLKKIFKKKEIKDKEKLMNTRIRSEYNLIKRIVKNSAHRIKEKTKDFFFNKAKKIVDIQKIWITSFKNSRDAHIDMHKQIADREGWFYAPSGQKTKHPSGFGVPELDINCNCKIKIKKVPVPQ